VRKRIEKLKEFIKIGGKQWELREERV